MTIRHVFGIVDTVTRNHLDVVIYIRSTPEHSFFVNDISTVTNIDIVFLHKFTLTAISAISILSAATKSELVGLGTIHRASPWPNPCSSIFFLLYPLTSYGTNGGSRKISKSLRNDISSYASLSVGKSGNCSNHALAK